MLKCRLFQLSDRKRELTSAQLQEKLKLAEQVWHLEGVLLFKHAASDLKTISERHARIGLVPHGYDYPELARRSGLPRQLEQVNSRKNFHKSHPF